MKSVFNYIKLVKRFNTQLKDVHNLKPVVKNKLPERIMYTRPDYHKLVNTNYKVIKSEARIKNEIEYSKVFGY